MTAAAACGSEESTGAGPAQLTAKISSAELRARLQIAFADDRSRLR
jgi:hypothetical protein